MAGTAPIRHGLAGDTCAFEQQRQRVGKKFGLTRTGGHAKSREPVALHGLMALDQFVRRMAFAFQFDGGIGEIATCGLAGQTVRPVFHPGKKLAARIARMGEFEVSPDFLSLFGGSAQSFAHELILGAKMTVERHLVGSSCIRDGIDADAANAALAEELRSRRDNTLPRGDSII